MTLHQVIVRIGSLFGRDRRERELDAELRYHLDMLTEQNIGLGMSPDRARREALRAFGTLEGVKDDVRDNWLSRFVGAVAQDVRYGFRSLRRSPGFALVVVLTMALGVGANTAIFSVVNGVLLRPLPYADGGQLVVLHQGAGDTVANDMGFSVKDIQDYRRGRSFSDIVEFHAMYFILLGRAQPERVSTGVVSANYFDVLGVKPLYGRTFVAPDDSLGAPAVLVLSNTYWQRSFGGDPNIVGRVFRMNDKPHTVVGVLPPVPQYPVAVDVYMPSSACPFRSNPDTIADRQDRMLTAFARVNPAISLSKSRADLGITAAQLAKTYPDNYPRSGFHATEIALKQDLTREFQPTLWILLGTASFVLLIVCASIANLLLARTVRREHELSVRAALGASRGRLLRQLLTESLILAVSGGLLGLTFSAYTLALLATFAERFGVPRAGEIAVDRNVLLFTLGMSVLTGLVFGSIAAFARRADVGPALQGGGRITHSSQRLRSVLIVAQISASFMLLIAAGLTLRSLMNVQRVDPGIQTENRVSFRTDIGFDRFPLTMPKEVRWRLIGAYWTAFEQRLRALPDVTAVGGAGTFPLNETDPFPGGLIREFHPPPPRTNPPTVSFRLATPDYFKTLGQRLVSGRAFTASDTFTATAVVIVTESTARHFWPNENPIGTRIRENNDELGTVVGVVADVRQQLDRQPADEIYVPLQQNGQANTTWIVQSRRPIEAVEAEIRNVVHAHDSDLAAAQFRTLDDVRATGLEPRRVVVGLIGLFAALALVITAAGIAGVIAFSVNQRTHEFGIRMALGARRGGVMALVLRQGVQLVTIGLVIGAAGAVVLTRLLTTVLFEVKPTDIPTYLGVAAVLMIVALVACALPARRAASVDPIVALRTQ